MATVKLIEYDAASPRVKAVFDEICQLRQIDDVNNFWKAVANHPDLLEHLWASLKAVMAPGELDSLTKEMIYIAVSVANNCEYCVHSHTASAFAKGMTEGQYSELTAVIGMATQTNALSNAMQVPVDAAFRKD